MSPLTVQVIALAAHSHWIHHQRCEPQAFPQQFKYWTLTFHQQAFLQDRLTDLEDLIRGEDGQAVSQDLQNLIVRTLSEIESWLNGEGAMSFEAQITLSNMAYNGPTKDNICNQFSCKV